MAVWGTTTYKELVKEGSPEVVIDGWSSYSVRTLDVYSDPVKAEKDFLGLGKRFFDGTNRYISRTLPMPDPDHAWLTAASLKYKGVAFKQKDEVGADDGAMKQFARVQRPVSRYKLYRFQLTYKATRYNVLDDNNADAVGPSGRPDESRLNRYVTIENRPGADYVQLPGGLLRLVDAPPVGVPPATQVLTHGVGKILPNYDYSVFWEKVPELAVPSSLVNRGAGPLAIENCIGRINQAAFLDFTPGQLLLLAATMDPDVQCDGSRIYRVGYRFKYLPQTHYKLPYKSNTAPPQLLFSDATTDGAGVGTHPLSAAGFRIYDGADFETLFAPPPI